MNPPLKKLLCFGGALLLGVCIVIAHVLNRMASRAPAKGRDEQAAKLLVENDNLQIELCYCSIYDECWLVDRYNEPKPIAQCNIDQNQRFMQ